MPLSYYREEGAKEEGAVVPKPSNLHYSSAIFLDDFCTCFYTLYRKRDTVINQCKGRKGVHTSTFLSKNRENRGKIEIFLRDGSKFDKL